MAEKALIPATIRHVATSNLRPSSSLFLPPSLSPLLLLADAPEKVMSGSEGDLSPILAACCLLPRPSCAGNRIGFRLKRTRGDSSEASPPAAEESSERLRRGLAEALGDEDDGGGGGGRTSELSC